MIAGWWLSPTPLKNMKVKWDYFFPIYGKIKAMFQATSQIGYDTADGRNPAPVDISGVSMFIPLFIGF